MGIMKKLLAIIALMMGLLVLSCSEPDSKRPDNIIDNPDKRTTIVFDNTRGMCAVSVYEDYRRRDEDKVADIPAGRLSEEIEWTPGDKVPFYFLYIINLKGVNGFNLNYVPAEVGKDQKLVRITAEKKTNITIPKLDETVSSPDDLLSNKSYLLIQNNSSFSFQLHMGTSIITPDNSSASLVNSEERAQYTINPGDSSPYQLLVGADYHAFPGSIDKFEAGHLYSFVFESAVSLVSEIEIKLENVAEIRSVPETPDAPPKVRAGDRMLTMSWIEVEETSSYEVWLGTSDDPASASKSGADITSSLSATISGLSNGTVYYVWVKAKNAAGASGFSPAANGKPIGNMGAVTVSAGNEQLSLSWSAVVGADQYEVYYSTGNSIPGSPALTVTETEATISGLTNGTTYYAWVKPINANGAGGTGAAVNGIPTVTMSTLNLSAGNQQITVTWTAVPGAGSYEVYYSTTTTIPLTPTDTITGLSKTITGLTNGTRYNFWIKAVYANGTRETSPAASGKPIGNIGTVTLSAGGSGILTLNWTAVAGADQYEVYYSAANTIPADPAQTVSTTTATISGLTNTTYVWVKPKNANGTGNASAVVSGTPNGVMTPGLYRGAEKIGEYNFANSIDYISANAVNKDIFYIVLGADESASPINLNYLGKTVEITLFGYGSERTITLNTNGRLFTINSGVTLTLDEKITIKGLSANDSSLVYLNNGKLVINNGAKITGNTFSSDYVCGGGVYVYGGTFTMNGGEISGNTAVSITSSTSSAAGGGVYVDGGTFAMNGGEISGNTVFGSNYYTYGGGVCVNGGTFTMNGGEISGNTSDSADTSTSGGGVYVGGGRIFTMNGGKISGNSSYYGGGVYNRGTFIMSNGEISVNSSFFGSGVYTSGTSFTMNSGKISGNTLDSKINSYSGSVHMTSGTFTMNDGEISGNTSTSSYGGGVFFSTGNTFTMNGGEISGNSGSGVNLLTGTFSMKGGEISGNTGGGVRFSSTGGTFSMNGGLISGNTSSSNGGGVSMYNVNFSMDGGKISGNTSSGTGGGVYMSNGNFSMNGGLISGNNSGGGGGVYLYNVDFSMDGGEISGNTSSDQGGGVYISNTSSNVANFTMNNGKIFGNKAVSGGGVWLFNGNFSMDGGKISGNTATSGGGVYNMGGNFVIDGGEISGNTASTYGGGVWCWTGKGAPYESFIKTGGIITGYASDTLNGNAVKSSSGVAQSNRGHAVYIDSSPVMRRETTAGPGVNLDSEKSGAAGGWQ